MHRFTNWTVLLVLLLAALPAAGREPDLLAEAKDPGPNSPDEPLAKEFSLNRAVAFLDAASLHWQKKRNCFTCHTNYAYLYARPLVTAAAPAHRVIREQAEKLVLGRWPEKGPRWDAEVVATAAALAFNDAQTTGKLHKATRIALDRMWQVQREDGGFNWLKCNWPPMESDDHYGATLAALAVGVAPEKYAQTAKATKGLQEIRRYLAKNPPRHLHHRLMILWVSSYLPAFMSRKDRNATIRELRSLQLKDGGWSAAALGKWKRSDGKPQDASQSDGYGTGFAIYVLRRAGIPASDPSIRRGIEWLKTHQRRSGRWFTRSLNRDNRHYLTHAGTAFAVMALRCCDTAAEK